MRLIAIAAIFLLATAHAVAQECSREEAEAAENRVSTLNSWQSTYDTFQEFGHCDDGAIAEGFSDRIVHLLATQWDSFPQVHQLIVRDPSFQSFFLRHINSSADISELDSIVRNASQQCPESAELLCKQIIGVARPR